MFPNPLSEQLICPLFSLFFDPVIFQCGHTFCRRVIDDSGDKVMCPIDGTGLVIVTTRIQFQALIIDYITILVPVSLKLRNNRF